MVHTPTFSVTVTGNAGWRLMSAPINNFPVATLSAKTGIQGFASDGFNRNFFTGYNGANWTPLASDPAAAQPTSITSGQGYLLYFFDNNNAGSTAIGSGMTFNAYGTESTTDVAVSVHADGNKLNLLGNPYSTAINVSGLSGDGDFTSTVLVWSDAENDWLASSDILTLNGKIAPWQGFILENDNATSITIPLSAKTTGGTFYKDAADDLAQLQFRLFTRDGDVATLRDRGAIVQFRPDALTGWDRHDLSKMGSLNATSALLYFVGDRDGASVAKTQESRPFDFSARVEIPFDVVSYGMGADMRLDWPVFHQLPEGLSIRVYDRVADLEFVLEPGASYDFTLTADRRHKSSGSIGGTVTASNLPRFTLIVEPEAATSTPDAGRTTPDAFALEQNYPNPFNPSTQIRFTLDAPRATRLSVYDLLGREVAVLVDGPMPAGAHNVSFDASSLSSGVYLYQLEAGGQVLTRRMTLVK